MNIHIKTAWDYIRRSPFQALAASFVLTLTFFVMTLVSVLVYSSSKLITYFETRPQVIAFLKSDAKDTEVADLQHSLSTDPHIKDIKYVSKEEALSIYKKATSDNPLLGQLVDPSIFPASLEFSVTDLSFAQSIIDNVKGEKIVDSVGFTAALGGETSLNDVVGRLKTVTTYVRVGGIVFVTLLFITSLVVLLVITSMRVVGRREEVEILNLIGATKGFIRSPIILEAFIYTLFGVILGWAVSFIAILYLAPTVVSYFGEIPVLPKTAIGIIELFGMIFVIEIFVGAVLALSGSLLAISRVKKAR
ncbi:MAG TPA: permease-like cell division protein FtsX [Candidatus Saccharimonadales bacterium]|jgi:cell division transport system permease protein|nr:permease-like cell division protein FtsX [Candidatus Saccharimonadales bacterium]